MIPKKIHYVWVGEKKKPPIVMSCIESWKKYCPDYEIIEWNNESLSQIDKNNYVREAYESKNGRLFQITLDCMRYIITAVCIATQI